ncbi:SDR family NAD(P)-dependent oxidoreductase [Thorsellia anophelis]|uniref:NAD(P)-dependent dehydrogenase, short-chain alcohol dehydrogenase family n=1 Tax=Thorsellia anophelis DSM 18579 TaxID=1123402 RepID=A0A1I0DZB5_9GAMM|nr:SDR family NAD(P)-dependent oxidoreductase [Thorsellia anophelis]SET37789.1 NAD(P)-dependent dehydrogenase, short-chain alcohol dehydrogenase family [Thorsellia anophelis DSM 18579]
MAFSPKRIVIIGSNGAIGKAFVSYFAKYMPSITLYALARKLPTAPIEGVQYHALDYLDEQQIKSVAESIHLLGSIDLVIVATGMLHDGKTKPEKSLNEITSSNLVKLFEVNTIIPTLMAKYFVPKLSRENKSVFAVLSARVGSIVDNRKGGWYAYRASKSALNMIIKCTAIESNRTHKHSIVIGLHPGTVTSELSEPFVKNINQANLFSPEESVYKLISVIENLESLDTGKCFAWDGQEILP